MIEYFNKRNRLLFLRNRNLVEFSHYSEIYFHLIKFIQNMIIIIKKINII